MATSITYKGSELASFSNNTKTLKTAGKYLEGDITISASTVLGTTTVIPSETTQTISPASGQEGLSSITVNGITNTYVGSSVPTGSLTVSGPTVTASAGYYASDVTTTIPDAVTKSSITFYSYPGSISVDDSNGVVSVERIATSGSKTIYSNSGYVDKNTNGKINYGVVVYGVTYQLPTLPAQSFTPSSSTQTVASTGKYMLGDITVEPIPSSYTIPTGTLTITAAGITDVSSYANVDVPEGEFYGQVVIPADLTGGTSTVQWAVDSTTGLVEVSQTGDGMLAPVYGSGYFSTSDSVYVYHGFSDDYQLPTLPAQIITPTKSTQTISSTGKYMTGDITVQPIPSEYIVPTGVTTITSNGTHNVTSFASASVNVQPNLEAKSFTPSETSTTITAGSGYDGLSSVTVAGITNTYVGSGIAKNPTITVSGPSVTIPAGYYSSQQTKTVASGSVDLGIEATVEALPTITVSASGLITALNNSTGEVEIEVNPGYISGNITGTIGIAGESTRQLPTQGATTITPSSSTQTIAGQKYLTGTITVNPIPSQYIVPSGTYTISSVDSTNTFNVTNYASAKVTITDADNIAY